MVFGRRVPHLFMLLVFSVLYCDGQTIQINNSDLVKRSRIDSNMYLYWLDLDKSYRQVLVDYGSYAGTQRGVTAPYKYYLATRERKGKWEQPWDDPWTLTDLSRPSGLDGGLNDDLNRRHPVTLESDIETEVKLLRVDLPEGESPQFHCTNESILLKRPYMAFGPDNTERLPCTIKDIRSNSAGTSFTVSVRVQWKNPLTKGFLKIHRNLLAYRYPVFGESGPRYFPYTTGYEVQESMEDRVHEKIIHNTPLPAPNNYGMEYAVFTKNVIGVSEHAASCVFHPPQPPHIEVIKLAISDRDVTRRDITFRYKNVKVKGYGEFPELQVFRNRFMRREGGQYSWTTVKPSHVPVRDVRVLDNTYTFVNVPLTGSTYFQADAFNIIGWSRNLSNVVAVHGPPPPTDLKLVRISENEENYRHRDYELSWTNPPDNSAVNPMIRNWVEYRELDGAGGGAWRSVEPSPLHIDNSSERHQHMVFKGLPATRCQFRVRVENYVAVSNDSNITPPVVIPTKPTHFTLKKIEKAEWSTEESPTRNFDFEYDNPFRHPINKVVKSRFQYRMTRDNNMQSWEPWTDTRSMKLTPDLSHVSRNLTDVFTDEYSAVQFRAVSIGLVGESEPSDIVTVERPSPPTLQLMNMSVIKPRSEEEEEYLEDNGLHPEKNLEFKITCNFNENNRLNNITKIVLQHRISQTAKGPTSLRQEPWQTTEPMDVDSDLTVFFKNLTLFYKKNNQPLAAQYRVMVKGLIGTSDPGDYMTITVPSPPRDLNYIYYGSDVECSRSCELEVDWWEPADAGSFPLTEYVIQYRTRSFANLLHYWLDNCTVPAPRTRTYQHCRDTHFMRQFITFDYTRMYRVIARNALGDSLPSNVIFETPFVPYHLNVSYRKDPSDSNSLVIDLEWERVQDRKVSYYIVQTNLFFVHDRRCFTEEMTLYSWETRAHFTKGIEFFDFNDIHGVTKQYHLPEFRVISRYSDMKTFGPTTCTTFFHFSLDEYIERGAGLKGYMP